MMQTVWTQSVDAIRDADKSLDRKNLQTPQNIDPRIKAKDAMQEDVISRRT
jgi:hypothetical protein